MKFHASNLRSDAQAEHTIVHFGDVIKASHEMTFPLQRELAIEKLGEIEVSIELSRDTASAKTYLQGLIADLKTLRP